MQFDRTVLHYASMRDDLDVLSAVLASSQVDVNKQDEVPAPQC